MSTTFHWSWVAILLMFILFDVVVTALIFAKVRRKNRYRGFEVITKPEEKE